MAKFVGNRTRSKEGPRHVTGRGLFTDDFQLPGMLQAMMLRSPYAHARIVSVDASEALNNLNVFAVVTPEDVKKAPSRSSRDATPPDSSARSTNTPARSKKSATSASPSARWRRATEARRKTPWN